MSHVTHTTIICPAAYADEARTVSAQMVGQPTLGAGVHAVAEGTSGPVTHVSWNLPVRDRFWDALLTKADELGALVYVHDEGYEGDQPTADDLFDAMSRENLEPEPVEDPL